MMGHFGPLEYATYQLPTSLTIAVVANVSSLPGLHWGGCHSYVSLSPFFTSPGVLVLRILSPSSHFVHGCETKCIPSVYVCVLTWHLLLSSLPSLLCLFPFCFHLSLYEERSEDWKRLLPIDLSVL
jgi:hypothetical protein